MLLAGQLIGKSRYLCDQFLCVPKFSVEDRNGTEIYRVRPETCVAGKRADMCACGHARRHVCGRLFGHLHKTRVSTVSALRPALQASGVTQQKGDGHVWTCA